MSVLALMEVVGVQFDSEAYTSTRKAITAQLAKLEKEAVALAGENFLITSPEQVANILFTKLKLPEIKSKDKGRSGSRKGKFPSTSESILAKLADKHPLPGIIIQHRHLSKTLNTYINPLGLWARKCVRQDHAHQLPGQQQPHRIHCHWNHSATATGRLSSSSPNLQNLPRTMQDGDGDKAQTVEQRFNRWGGGGGE